MAYLKTGKHYHANIAINLPAAGMVVIQRALNFQDHCRGDNYHAPGFAAIGIGLLFVAGI